MSSGNEELFPEVKASGKKKSKKRQVFKPYEQNQVYLFPPSTDELLDKNHIARLVSSIVDELDLSELIKLYEGGGTSAYHPAMMLKVWVLAYLSRIYSCRFTAKALRENVAFMWISGGQKPNYHTLNRFRKKSGKQLKNIFKQIVKLALKKGMITGREIFIDHTKIEADANRHKMVWRKTVEKRIKNIDEELNELFEHIEKVNKDEELLYGDRDLDERERDGFSNEELGEIAEKINEVIKNPESKSKKSKFQGLRKTVRRAKELLERLSKYKLQKSILGNRNSYSRTDPDATAMMMKYGIIRPGYNEGIATEDRFVLNYELHDSSSDSIGFKKTLDGAVENMEKKPESVTADGAYGTEDNLQYLEDQEIEAYVKYYNYYNEKKKSWVEERIRSTDFQHDEEQDTYKCPNGAILHFTNQKTRVSKLGYTGNYRIYQTLTPDCKGCNLRYKCKQTESDYKIIEVNPNYERLRAKARSNLDSEDGRRLRRMRAHAVETTFGDRKRNNGRCRTWLRGMEGAKIDSSLTYMALNIKWMYKYIFGVNPGFESG